MCSGGRCGGFLTVILLGLGCAQSLLALGCAQSRPVQPLAAGEQLAGVSLGGPMVRLFGAAFPSPILQVSAAHGVRERLAVTGNLDLTAALYGTLHLEPGAVWHAVVRPAGALPSVALAGSLHLLTDFSDLLVAPQLAGLLSWPMGAHALYAGVDAAVAVQEQTRVLAGPLVGAELRLGRLGLALELKWLAPYYDVDPVAPGWLSPAQHGFLSVLLGVRYHRKGRP